MRYDKILVEDINNDEDIVIIITKLSNKNIYPTSESYVINRYKMQNGHKFVQFDSAWIIAEEKIEPLMRKEMTEKFKEEINTCLDYCIPFRVYNDRNLFFRDYPFYKEYLEEPFKKEYEALHEDTPF